MVGRLVVAWSPRTLVCVCVRADKESVRCALAVPAVVIDGITRYLRESYVNLNAGYPMSVQATSVVKQAHEVVSLLFNAGEVGPVMLGGNSTQLLRLLSECYADVLQPGDEIVVQESNHEANIGTWVRLERRGIVVKFWQAHPTTGDRYRVVCCGLG